MDQNNRISPTDIFVWVICSLLILVIGYLSVFGLGGFRTTQTILFENAAIRFSIGTLFFIIMIRFGYKKLYAWKWNKQILLLAIPALLIAINNFPIIAYLSGRTTFTASSMEVVAFLLESVSTGWFEEIVFRSMILVVILQRSARTTKGILTGIVLSSILFGFIHIINIFQGASVSATILQIGYSTLTGMLFSVVYILTKNIWIPIVIHTIYNVSGALFVTTGFVIMQWDIWTILITVLLSVGVAYYYLNKLFDVNPEEVHQFIEPQSN